MTATFAANTYLIRPATDDDATRLGRLTDRSAARA
jgi:hypothetical protein